MTQLGVRRYMEWMRFVKWIGWEKSTWNKLADLWLEHHDENGNLTHSSTRGHQK